MSRPPTPHVSRVILIRNEDDPVLCPQEDDTHTPTPPTPHVRSSPNKGRKQCCVPGCRKMRAKSKSRCRDHVALARAGLTIRIPDTTNFLVNRWELQRREAWEQFQQQLRTNRDGILTSLRNTLKTRG